MLGCSLQLTCPGALKEGHRLPERSVEGLLVCVCAGEGCRQAVSEVEQPKDADPADAASVARQNLLFGGLNMKFSGANSIYCGCGVRIFNG